ncbi:MAG: site-specific DNA-methyltransferase [Oligoflexia bacterium]|nr:site-specific DNA-methyltransferase [Oligoflexia bacterium]
MHYKIYQNDCLKILKDIPSDSVESMVTDPPAGIGFIGLEWDSSRGGKQNWIYWLAEIMKECHRVLKPGAHGLIWALPRTSHWTAEAVELAGFEIKDVIIHVFGSGFPKNIAIDKAINRSKYLDKDILFKVTTWIKKRRNEQGLTNKQLDDITGIKGGACHWTATPPHGQPQIPTLESWEKLEPLLGPAPEWLTSLIKPAFSTGEPKEISQKWEGWGTALKPATEHWLLVQKPIEEHNVAANVLKFSVGGLNIDDSRIETTEKIQSTTNLSFHSGKLIWDAKKRSSNSIYTQHPDGRYPSNFLISKSDLNCPTKILDKQSHQKTDVSRYFKTFPFVYCEKANKNEKGVFNNHPTVKPLELIKYFCSMITPEDGTILDPFMGSGTTGVAAHALNYHFIGIEQSSEYFLIAQKRLKNAEESIYE